MPSYKNRPKWAKPLDRKDWGHLRWALGPSPALSRFKKMRLTQIEWSCTHKTEACWDCRTIARKLGIN